MWGCILPFLPTKLKHRKQWCEWCITYHIKCKYLLYLKNSPVQEWGESSYGHTANSIQDGWEKTIMECIVTVVRSICSTYYTLFIVLLLLMSLSDLWDDDNEITWIKQQYKLASFQDFKKFIQKQSKQHDEEDSFSESAYRVLWRWGSVSSGSCDADEASADPPWLLLPWHWYLLRPCCEKMYINYHSYLQEKSWCLHTR